MFIESKMTTHTTPSGVAPVFAMNCSYKYAIPVGMKVRGLNSIAKSGFIRLACYAKSPRVSAGLGFEGSINLQLPWYLSLSWAYRRPADVFVSILPFAAAFPASSFRSVLFVPGSEWQASVHVPPHASCATVHASLSSAPSARG